MDELEKEKKEEEKKRDKSRPSNRNGRDFEKWRIVVKSRTVGIQSVESRLLCLLLQLVVTVFDEFIRDRVGNCVASWMKLSASWIDTVVRHCCPRAFFSAAFVFIDCGEANFLRRTRWDDRKKSTTPPSAFIPSSSHFIDVLLAPLKVPLARPSQLRIRFAVVMQRKNRNRYFQVERKCRKKREKKEKRFYDRCCVNCWMASTTSLSSVSAQFRYIGIIIKLRCRFRRRERARAGHSPAIVNGLSFGAGLLVQFSLETVISSTCGRRHATRVAEDSRTSFFSLFLSFLPSFLSGT